MTENLYSEQNDRFSFGSERPFGSEDSFAEELFPAGEISAHRFAADQFATADEFAADEFAADEFAAEEEMIRYAEELPRLSPKLRSRVLDHAFQAQRRSVWRQNLQGAAVAAGFAAALLVATFVVALLPGPAFRSPAVASHGGPPAQTAPAAARGLYALPEVRSGGLRGYTDDWTLVEIWFAARSENLETLKNAFWQ